MLQLQRPEQAPWGDRTRQHSLEEVRSSNVHQVEADILQLAGNLLLEGEAKPNEGGHPT